MDAVTVGYVVLALLVIAGMARAIHYAFAQGRGGSRPFRQNTLAMRALADKADRAETKAGRIDAEVKKLARRVEVNKTCVEGDPSARGRASAMPTRIPKLEELADQLRTLQNAHNSLMADHLAAKEDLNKREVVWATMWSKLSQEREEMRRDLVSRIDRANFHARRLVEDRADNTCVACGRNPHKHPPGGAIYAQVPESVNPLRAGFTKTYCGECAEKQVHLNGVQATPDVKALINSLDLQNLRTGDAVVMPADQPVDPVIGKLNLSRGDIVCLFLPPEQLTFDANMPTWDPVKAYIQEIEPLLPEGVHLVIFPDDVRLNVMKAGVDMARGDDVSVTTRWDPNHRELVTETRQRVPHPSDARKGRKG